LGNYYVGIVPSVISGSPSTHSSIAIATPGIYLFTYTLQISATVNPTEVYTSITGTNTYGTSVGISPINIGNTSSSGSQVVNCTASTYGLRLTYAGGSGLSVSTGFFTALRIG